MPKVQQLIAPAPQKSPKSNPVRSSKTNCGIADFKRSLSEARKKDESAPAEAAKKPEPAAKSKRAKKNTESKPADDAPAENSTETTDVTEALPVETAHEVEDVEENPDVEKEAPVVVKEQATSNAEGVAAVIPQAMMVIDADETAEATDTDVGEEVAKPIAPQAIAKPTTNEGADETIDALSDVGGDAVADEVAAIEDEPVAQNAAPASKPKHVTKPAPLAAAEAAAEAKEETNAKPQAAPSIEALEQAVAAFDNSQQTTTAPSTPTADPKSTAATIGAPPAPVDRPAAVVSRPAAPAPQPPVTPQSFAEVNHPKIVTSVRAELLPTGGTMQIRLDPPELGALQVLVHMKDGAMTASFQTSNDDATKLLSHSLGQLKQVLESQGVSVDKLHVQQAPRDPQASNDEQRQHQQGRHDDESARHEQQRKEMLRRMWRRLSVGQDPLDLVA